MIVDIFCCFLIKVGDLLPPNAVSAKSRHSSSTEEQAAAILFRHVDLTAVVVITGITLTLLELLEYRYAYPVTIIFP